MAPKHLLEATIVSTEQNLTNPFMERVHNPEAALLYGLEIGNIYFFRSIPLYYIGTVVAVTEKIVILTDACWVKNTGHFETFWDNSQEMDIRRYPEDRLIRVRLDRAADYAEYPNWNYGNKT